MKRREAITDIVTFDLEFFKDTYDKALLGYAESGGPNRHILPCYGYQALKVVLRDKGITDPGEMYMTISRLVSEARDDMRHVPLILTKVNRKALWRIITEKKYPRWDTLDKGIIGLCSQGWDQLGIMYSKPLVLSILASNQTSVGATQLQEAGRAATMLDRNIIPINLGVNTPWFLTPVN